jgi:hypothetical protein
LGWIEKKDFATLVCIVAINEHKMAPSGTKQRRGKKEATGASNSTPLTDQLDQARAAIYQSKQQTSRLHKQWRTYLLRLSYLLILISMHQRQGPSAACIRDIKTFNAIAPSDKQISGANVLLLLFSDTFPYICAVVISACLSFFLILETPGSFSDSRYVVANAFLPVMIGSHFVNKDRTSCLATEQSAMIQPEPLSRSLPVVAVFHIIVTLCCWFISYQEQQQAQNIRMVESLQRDLDEAKKSRATGSKSKSSGIRDSSKEVKKKK